MGSSDPVTKSKYSAQSKAQAIDINEYQSPHQADLEDHRLTQCVAGTTGSAIPSGDRGLETSKGNL